MGTGLVVAVTGGRNYTQVRALHRVLDRVHRRKGIRRLVHGGQRGADTAAAGWAALNRVECQPYHAEWDRFRTVRGKNPAGPIRNRMMLQTERPDVLIAFPGNDGTAHCVKLAKRLGIFVWEPFAGVLADAADVRGREAGAQESGA